MIRSEQQSKMKFILFTAFLLSISVEVTVCEGLMKSCCLAVSKIRIPAENILKYEMQSSVICNHVRAVRFLTRKNKIICSDPDSKWAKKIMCILDERMTTGQPSKEPTMCYTSTTHLIPTTVTLDRTLETETEPSASTFVPKIVKTPTDGVISETSPNKKKLSKMMLRKIGKSKKGLRKVDGHPDCCDTVTNTRIPVEDIMLYDMQETNQCPVRAVRFHTKTNIMICSDPDSFWAQIAKATVGGRRTTEKTLGSETRTSTSTPVPPIATTIKTTGLETSTSTPVPPIVTTIKTTGPETSTSTPVPPIVTTIKTTGPETSTSTPVPPIVTTIKTTGPETSTSTPVPPIVTTIKTTGPETSTSTPVPPIVTTIKTTGPETSTSTPVPPIVTTIKTTGPETSTSTPVPPIVTTIKTTGPETSTSTPVPPIVTTIKTTGPETSTSTPVPPIVTTIKTTGPETSTSTPVPPIVTTIKTTGPETSTSTPVPPIVTTIKTTGPETSTSTPVPPIVTTIKTTGPETSTSTPVPPIVTTIKTTGPETSTSTPVPPIVTTIKITGPETSTSTLVPPILTTIETTRPEISTSTPVPPIEMTSTSGLETETSKTTTQTTSVSKENPKSSLSTATTFQTVTSSTTKDCCLTVTKNKPSFHEIVDYRVQETPICSVRAVQFITVKNNMICSSPEDWVQDYIQNLNIRRKTTDKTDKREFAVTRIKPLEQDQRRSVEGAEIFQLGVLSKLEKK